MAYLGFDTLVLWTAFPAIGVNPVPGFAQVIMAYIISAIAAVLVYEAVGLIVPLIGGGLAYLFLRRELGPMESVHDAPYPAAEGTD